MKRLHEFVERHGFKLISLGALILVALLTATILYAQTPPTITFTAVTTTGNGSVVPAFTWSTSPTASSCTASGDPAWTGTKPPAGSATLAAITKGKTYALQCTWLDDDADLSWVAPTKNTDGSDLTNLSGFRLTYGSAVNLDKSIDIAGASTTTFKLKPLPPGTYYFQLRAVTSQGAGVYFESEPAPAVPLSLVVGAKTVTEQVTIAVNPVPLPPTNLRAL